LADDEESRTALKILRARFLAEFTLSEMRRSFAVFTLSQLRRFFASLRMTGEGLRMTANGLGMTAWRGFLAACKSPPFLIRIEKLRLVFGFVRNGSRAAVGWPGFLRGSHIGMRIIFG